MSTGYIDKTSRKLLPLSRFAQLAKLGELVFHADDLANLWHITNANTLYTTLKRYTHKGLLFRIYKGLYAIKPPSQIDPNLIGVKAIHGPAYISTETVLVNQGIMQQALPAITLISSHPKRFSILGTEYYSRALPDVYLYQPLGITTNHLGVRVATTERAIADLLYLNPQAHFDAGQFINWGKVQALQELLGYPVARIHKKGA